jgi:beta-xylosidase
LPRGFYDPGLFFDEDGKIYVAHGYGTIYVTELDTNFTAKGSDVLVFTGDIRDGLEGSHMYKINGYYYLYCTYGGRDGFQVALRSDNIYGPYDEMTVIRDDSYLGTGLHQGALIETQTGEWWTVIFQDGGAFGRFPSLQPVTWQDDWPMVGVDGKGVITYAKPNVGKEYPVTILPTSDEFENTTLGLQWGWNHNPDSTKWSLTENPGYLRLKTAKVVSNLRDARNTLTQRIFAYYTKTLPTTATVRMNTAGMQNGDVAGLAVFQNPYAYIGIKRSGGVSYVVMINNGTRIDSARVDSSTLYLRAQANYGTSRVSFAYSLDNGTFIKLGNELAMQFSLTIFTGNKFCLFNYATIATGGYVDFDWFSIYVGTPTGIVPDEGHSLNQMPHQFFLGQNFPNPFNPTTTIKYSIPESQFITLKVFDMLGRELAILVKGKKPAGTYEVKFDASSLASGIYFCQLQTSGFSDIKKLVLMK